MNIVGNVQLPDLLVTILQNIKLIFGIVVAYLWIKYAGLRILSWMFAEPDRSESVSGGGENHQSSGLSAVQRFIYGAIMLTASAWLWDFLFLDNFDKVAEKAVSRLDTSYVGRSMATSAAQVLPAFLPTITPDSSRVAPTHGSHPSPVPKQDDPPAKYENPSNFQGCISKGACKGQGERAGPLGCLNGDGTNVCTLNGWKTGISPTSGACKCRW